MTTNLEHLLVGNWMQNDSQPEKNCFGVGIEKFHKNKTKDTFVVVKNNMAEIIEIKSKSTWSVDKNILTEEVTDIDKTFGKKNGIKIGLIMRAYISHLDEETLVITPLNKKHTNKKTIHFKRYYEQ